MGNAPHEPRTGSGSAAHRVRVLLSSFEPGPTSNPYSELLASSLPDEVAWHWFSWREALLGRYDAVHLHWPELLVRGSSRAQSARNATLFAVLLLRWRLQRTALVQTIHNDRPHEPGSLAEGWLLRRLTRRIDLWIALNPTTPSRLPETRIIPHGHYVGWFHVPDDGEPTPGRLLFFGIVRRYKGVEPLVRAFRSLPAARTRVSLRVVGRADDPSLASEIEAAAAGDARIGLRLSPLDDDELACEILCSEAAVLAYREVGNSGAALTALSLGRPVVITDSPSMQNLRDEVGPDWVHLMPSPVTAAALADALAWLEDTRAARAGGAPDLSRRDWHLIGEAHGDAYRAALARARPSRRAS